MEVYLNPSDLKELSLEEMILIDGGKFFADLWDGFKDGFLIALYIVVVLAAA